jgi:glycosyltransferase involved in cell wall biosynthesis
MKIKMISITHYSTLYGANRSLLNLILGTRDKVDWTIICKPTKDGSSDIRAELAALKVSYYSVPFLLDIFVKGNGVRNHRLFFSLEFIYNFFIAAIIALYAKVNKVRIIHTNSSATCLGAYVCAISAIPHVWHFREFLLEDYNGNYKFGFNYLAYWGNKAAKIIAVSHSIYRRCIIERGIQVTTNIIYNGVIAERALRPFTDKQPGHVLQLVIVGVLTEGKNQLEAIKAVQILKSQEYPVHLNIVGTAQGEYYETLRRYVASANLSDVVSFSGYITDQQDIYEKADVSIICAKNEGMGRVTVESMANGIPVIGYNAAGTAELIAHGHTGLLYEENEKDLALSIQYLCYDRETYSRIRRNGFREVLQKYTIEVYAHSFLISLGI